MAKHKTSNGHRKYYRISFEDYEWLSEQTEGVRRLWAELSKADPYGTKQGVPFKTSLKHTAFFTAKKKIQDYGAFEIFQTASDIDRRVKEWRVFNRHGSNIRSYWEGSKDATDSYEEFLQSDYWKQVRDWIIERDNHTCQSCGATTNLQVHHLTYDNHGYEHEHLEDLVTLCRRCHERVHELT